MPFFSFSIIDFLDIFLVATLLYSIFVLIRKSIAISIFIGIVAIYLLWLIVRALEMELLTSLLGQFTGLGFIAIIVVFQQEIRKLLFIIGKRNTKIGPISLLRFLRQDDKNYIDADAIIKALKKMASTKTGSLIVIGKQYDFSQIQKTGITLNADVSEALLISIFNKNSPLHDGAVIIQNNKILAAGCTLPVDYRENLPAEYGMRHRSAICMSDQTNTIVLVVSEERGTISYSKEGSIAQVQVTEELYKILSNYFDE
ncbi:MAG: diadenylate cyclase CdaA [Bacteroidales bacterium]